MHVSAARTDSGGIRLTVSLHNAAAGPPIPGYHQLFVVPGVHRHMMVAPDYTLHKDCTVSYTMQMIDNNRLLAANMSFVLHNHASYVVHEVELAPRPAPVLRMDAAAERAIIAGLGLQPNIEAAIQRWWTQ